jgi:hypothetical protein
LPPPPSAMKRVRSPAATSITPSATLALGPLLGAPVRLPRLHLAEAAAQPVHHLRDRDQSPAAGLDGIAEDSFNARAAVQPFEQRLQEIVDTLCHPPLTTNREIPPPDQTLPISPDWKRASTMSPALSPCLRVSSG